MLTLIRFKSTSKGQMNNVPTSKMKDLYRKIFGKYLSLTNTLSCGIMMAGGDIIQQEIEHFKYNKKNENSGYDWARAGRMLIIGLIQGVPQHMFYASLDRRLPGRSFKTISTKMIIDQLVASPIFIVTFFMGMSALEGHSLQEELNELRKKFWTVYMVDCCIWPPSQFINFNYVPARYRVTYINVVTMLYDVFLSYMHHDT